MEQEFTVSGNHRLIDGEQTTKWAGYRQFTYLNGMVGVTDYFAGVGEKILTPEEFAQVAGGW